MECRRCLVSGRVQGVFFRASAQRQALALGVTGYARNMADGSVLVLACGTSAALEAFCAWLREGPPHAVVGALDCETVTATAPATFTTG